MISLNFLWINLKPHFTIRRDVEPFKTAWISPLTFLECLIIISLLSNRKSITHSTPPSTSHIQTRKAQSAARFNQPSIEIHSFSSSLVHCCFILVYFSSSSSSSSTITYRSFYACWYSSSSVLFISIQMHYSLSLYNTGSFSLCIHHHSYHWLNGRKWEKYGTEWKVFCWNFPLIWLEHNRDLIFNERILLLNNNLNPIQYPQKFSSLNSYVIYLFFQCFNSMRFQIFSKSDWNVFTVPFTKADMMIKNSWESAMRTRKSSRSDDGVECKFICGVMASYRLKPKQKSYKATWNSNLVNL